MINHWPLPSGQPLLEAAHTPLKGLAAALHRFAVDVCLQPMAQNFEGLGSLRVRFLRNYTASFVLCGLPTLFLSLCASAGRFLRFHHSCSLLFSFSFLLFSVAVSVTVLLCICHSLFSRSVFLTGGLSRCFFLPKSFFHLSLIAPSLMLYVSFLSPAPTCA